MLEAKRDAFLIFVDVEYYDIKFLTYLDHFTRVINAPPAHISDMKEAIKTIEVDEGSKISDVFDLTLDYNSRVHASYHFSTFCRAFFLNKLAAGENDILPLHVYFHDLEFHLFADQCIKIMWLNNIDL